VSLTRLTAEALQVNLGGDFGAGLREHPGREWQGQLRSDRQRWLHTPKIAAGNMRSGALL